MHHRNRRIIALVSIASFASLSSSAPAQAILTTFDNDTEGWRPGTSTSVSWQESAGNPGGYLRVDDAGSADDMTILAPDRYLGDLRVFDGDFLGFDSRIVELYDSQGGIGAFGIVTIVGVAGTAHADLVTTVLTGEWTRFARPLTAAAWGKSRSDWLAILSDVRAIVVECEYAIGDEQIGFDNIIVGRCPADFDLDGAVSTLDVLAFLNAWTRAVPAADFNADGFINSLDVLQFLNAWSAGC